MEASPAIRLATPTDIPAIMTLEARYYIGNLDERSRANGFISVQHSAESLAAAITTAGIHVAEIGGERVGFIVVTALLPQPDAAPGSFTRAMLDLAQTTMFRGRLLAEQRVACRGPVLIAEAARGRGIYTAFNG